MKLWHRLKCWLGFHTRGYPTGWDNGGFHGFRVDYFTCEHCRKTVYWAVKVAYGAPGTK